ncbi:hypothetical protein [Sphingomonas sp. DT-204]|uniref:hypothetical protein n=1 Tax=Sphingomonas sp. DT-204 TaxID=3396166 RepID=UPI003F1AA8E9
MVDVLARVRRYIRQTGMAPTQFGRRAVNDPRLVSDLVNGREPRSATVARIDAYIAAHPEGRP